MLNGFNLGPLVNAGLINLYLLKFFYWETGYFNTLDITLDRAGYYLCWGCLTWVQIFYTFSAYFLVSQPILVSSAGSGVILMFGLTSLGLNYWADYQKEKFKVSIFGSDRSPSSADLGYLFYLSIRHSHWMIFKGFISTVES